MARIKGTDGDDRLETTAGRDVVRGYKGEDVIGLSTGHDRLRGGAGADLLFVDMTALTAAGSSHQLTIGDGFARDTSGAIDSRLALVERLRVVLTADGDTVDASGFAGDAGQFDGGAGNDTILGTKGADLIIGGGGDDRIDGGAGDDRIFADTTGGSHVLDGGDGFDTTWVTIDASRPADQTRLVIEAVKGGFSATADGHTSLFRGFEDVTVGFDTLLADTPYGVEIVSTARESMRINGTNGNADLLSAGSGDDALWGLSGDDTLSGGAGRDTLWAGQGRDVLDGGTGDDTLVGGYDEERDTFVFGEASGQDTIELFETGHDVIRIAVAGITGFDQLQITSRNHGRTFVVGFDAATITVEVAGGSGELTAANFVFGAPEADVGSGGHGLSFAPPSVPGPEAHLHLA